MGLASRDVDGDPAEAVAQIAAARRGRLLRVYRRRLRWEDLEDCYSQATLELVTRSRRAPFVSYQHILNAMARYLHVAGAPADYRDAIYAYNHAWWYVADVLAWAHRYRAEFAPADAPSAAALAGAIVRLPVEAPWLAPLPGTALRCDARVIADVEYILTRFGLRATSCYRDDGPNDHGEHPLGVALDAVPSDGDWSQALAAAQAFGWQAACGSTGCADRLHAPMRFIGYNGYPDHGDPAHAGANAHIHFSWIHAPAAPNTPAAWVEVFTTAQGASIP